MSKEGLYPEDCGLYFPTLPRLCMDFFFFSWTSAADYVFETGSLELSSGRFKVSVLPHSLLVGLPFFFFLFGGE